VDVEVEDEAWSGVIIEKLQEICAEIMSAGRVVAAICSDSRAPSVRNRHSFGDRGGNHLARCGAHARTILRSNVPHAGRVTMDNGVQEETIASAKRTPRVVLTPTASEYSADVRGIVQKTTIHILLHKNR